MSLDDHTCGYCNTFPSHWHLLPAQIIDQLDILRTRRLKRKWHSPLLLSQYVLHLCHWKPNGNEHKLLLSCRCEIEEGMLSWWMSLLPTEMEGKTNVFMHQIFNDCCSTPENGSKMHYWTHSTKSLRNTPASYWHLFQIESQHTPHFISRILCAQTGSWHI